MQPNFNQATKQGLQMLGLQPDWAAYIIDSRDYYHGFKSITDIDKLDLPIGLTEIIQSNFIFDDQLPLTSSPLFNDATEDELILLGIPADWAKYIIDSRVFYKGISSKTELDKLQLPQEYYDVITKNYILNFVEVDTPAQPIIPDIKLDKNWPPISTNVSQYSLAAKQTKFGKFEYEPNPAESDGDGIKILGTWVKDNIKSIPIPQLVGIIVGDHYPDGKKYTATNSKIEFNKNGEQQLIQLWQDWEDAGLLSKVISFHGGFVPRYTRKSQDRNPRPLSNHSWGTAFDINYRWNQLGETPALLNELGCVRELVEIANNNGFFWGGHFGGGRTDGMHFELGVV